VMNQSNAGSSVAASRTPVVSIFGSAKPTPVPDAGGGTDPDLAGNTGQPPIAWGAVAMAAMGGLTAYVLDEQRKRKQAEAQQKAEVELRAARFNAEQEQRRAEALEEQREQAEIAAYWAAKTAQDSGGSGNAPRMSTNLAEMDDRRAMVYSQEDIDYYQTKLKEMKKRYESNIEILDHPEKVFDSSTETERPWWVSSNTESKARELARMIPSVKVNTPWRNPIPLWRFVSPGHAISFGVVTKGLIASDANPNAMAGFDKSLAITIGLQPFLSFTSTSRRDGFDITVRNSWHTWKFAENQIQASLTSSTTFRVTWGGFLNTTIGVDVNNPEVTFRGGGLKGRISGGFYFEWKPGRLITYAMGAQLVVGIVVAGILLVPSTAPVLIPVYETIKHVVTNLVNNPTPP